MVSSPHYAPLLLALSLSLRLLSISIFLCHWLHNICCSFLLSHLWSSLDRLLFVIGHIILALSLSPIMTIFCTSIIFPFRDLVYFLGSGSLIPFERIFFMTVSITKRCTISLVASLSVIIPLFNHYFLVPTQFYLEYPLTVLT